MSVVRPLTIGVVAGEPSGDALGGHLLTALRQVLPQVRFEGIAGKAMQAAGAHSWYPLEALTVWGHWAALRHYRRIVRIRNTLLQRWQHSPPDLFIGIDAPGFNLDLEISLRKQGVKVVHYVSPSIWAWRGERIHKIARAVDHILTLFPFEPALYQAAHIPVTYVGHPLADLIPHVPDRARARAQLQVETRVPLFAWLVGSRRAEIEALAPVYIRAAVRIRQQLPEAVFAVPLVDNASEMLFQAYVRQLAPQLASAFRYCLRQASTVLCAADVGLIASGTATLEAALWGCPHVITYKISALSWWLAKRKAYLPYVGLPNILAQRWVVPEHLQDEANPEMLAQAVLGLWHDSSVRQAQQAVFTQLHTQLQQNTAATAAKAILSVLHEHEISTQGVITC